MYWSIWHRYYREAASSEVKVEDASFTVPSNSSKSYNHGKCIPLACAFDEDDLALRVHRNRSTDHRHTSVPGGGSGA